jgi:hypothetical protein
MDHAPDFSQPARVTVPDEPLIYLWMPCICGDDQCWYELQARTRRFVGGSNVDEFPEG